MRKMDFTAYLSMDGILISILDNVYCLTRTTAKQHIELWQFLFEISSGPLSLLTLRGTRQKFVVSSIHHRVSSPRTALPLSYGDNYVWWRVLSNLNARNVFVTTMQPFNSSSEPSSEV